MAAFFSALCLALAAFARSTKEGQYYLMPLLMLTMPLVILPMAPGVELNLGNSLIPVTGIVLLLRSVLEGDYWQAAQYSPVVAAVTLAACLMAIRWAVEQFNCEAVLFRESERLDLRLWAAAVVARRRPTPSAAAAVCCGVLILMLHFFVSCSLTAPADFGGLARTFLVPQLLVIVPPALLMTLIFTRSPRETLLLRRPRVAGHSRGGAAGGRVAPDGEPAARARAAALPGERGACCRSLCRCRERCAAPISGSCCC